MAVVTIKEMLEAGAHFGHQTKRWNPKMKKFIFGERNGIYIIDLQKTVRLFDVAVTYVRDIVAQGRHILFVGTKKQAQDILREEAERCGMFYVNQRWLGGMLTNYETIKKSIDRLKKLEMMQTDGSMELRTKKEAAGLDKERGKLERVLSGIKDMPGLPEALFIIDPKREHIAVLEAQRLGIKVIATLDTNCDPDEVDLPIPANDDAIRAIRLLCARVADAAIEGKALRIHRTPEPEKPVEATPAETREAVEHEGKPVETFGAYIIEEVAEQDR